MLTDSEQGTNPHRNQVRTQSAQCLIPVNRQRPDQEINQIREDKLNLQASGKDAGSKGSSWSSDGKVRNLMVSAEKINLMQKTVWQGSNGYGLVYRETNEGMSCS